MKKECHWMKFFRSNNRQAGISAQGGQAVTVEKSTGEPIAEIVCATATLGWTNCGCYRVTFT